MIDALLIHSPLVGPLTLRPLATALAARGITATVPDLRDALTAPRPQWQRFLDLACSAATGRHPDLIVGHSGAGVLLPLLADRVSAGFVVFVDAVVPADRTAHEATAEFIGFIDSLPREGDLLPPWHTWWGGETMQRLVPERALRERIAADTPCVPRSFYDDPVPLPAGWTSRRGCCYLQLSPGYDEDRARAAAYGWPTARLDGQHLDVAVRPDDVAGALLALIAQ